jgi:hypothetical protein
VHLNADDYAAQLALSRKISAFMENTARSFNAAISLRAQFDARTKALPPNPPKELADAFADFAKQLESLEDGTEEAPGFGLLNRDFSHYLVMVQSADLRPGESAYRAVTDSCQALANSIAAWNKLNTDLLPALNKQLAAQNAPVLPAAPTASAPSCAP